MEQSVHHYLTKHNNQLSKKKHSQDEYEGENISTPLHSTHTKKMPSSLAKLNVYTYAKKKTEKRLYRHKIFPPNNMI